MIGVNVFDLLRRLMREIPPPDGRSHAALAIGDVDGLSLSLPNGLFKPIYFDASDSGKTLDELTAEIVIHAACSDSAAPVKSE